MKKEMWLIWKNLKVRRDYKIGILTKDNEEYEFKYVDPELNDAKKTGFNYYPGFEDVNTIYRDERLFANIANRLPNSKRPDYLEILNAFNLEKKSTELEILTATKGKLLTDNYEFVSAFDSSKLEFEVAGTQYSKDIKKCMNLLKINDKLYFELESQNKYDENAIKVIYIYDNKKYHIGYVPRYYSKQLLNLLSKNTKYSAMIQYVNLETRFIDESITISVKLIFND